MEAKGMDVIINLLIVGSAGVKQQAAAMVKNLIDRMVEFLNAADDSTKQEQGALAVRYLAAFGSEERKAIIAEGAFEPLLAVLRSSSSAPIVLVEASGALQNLAVDNAFGKIFVSSGALPVLSKLLESKEAQVQQHAAGAFRCLADDKFGEFHEDIISNSKCKARQIGALPKLVGILSTGSAKAREEAAGALACLTSVHKVHKQAAFEAGIIAPCVEILEFKVEEEASAEVEHLATEALAAESETLAATSERFTLSPVTKRWAATVLKHLCPTRIDDIVFAGGLKALETLLSDALIRKDEEDCLAYGDALKAMGAA